MSSILDAGLDRTFPGANDDPNEDATHMWVAGIVAASILAIVLIRKGLGSGAY